MKEALGSQAFNLLSAVGTCNPSSCGVIGRLLDWGVMVGVGVTSNNGFQLGVQLIDDRASPLLPLARVLQFMAEQGRDRNLVPPRQPLPYAYNMVVGVSVCAADPADDEIDLSVLQ